MFINSPVFVWVILPLLIFIARILDVSIGTLRIIFVSRGMKYLAPLLGFFEVLIWLIAIGQIMQHLDNVMCYIAYAGGFAAGNYLGIIIEQKLKMGIYIVRIITQKNANELIAFLRSKDYGITSIDAEGSQGKVSILYSIIRRKNLNHFIESIEQFNPNAFYTIEDVRFVSKGIFSPIREIDFISRRRIKNQKRK